MPLFRKKPKGEPGNCKKGFLALRCGAAVITGLAIVTIITMGLIVISDADDAWHDDMAQYSIRFPEDEEMLADLSSRILEQAAASADRAVAEGLADIEPAAGDITDIDNENIGESIGDVPPPPKLPEE